MSRDRHLSAKERVQIATLRYQNFSLHANSSTNKHTWNLLWNRFFPQTTGRWIGCVLGQNRQAAATGK